MPTATSFADCTFLGVSRRENGSQTARAPSVSRFTTDFRYRITKPELVGAPGVERPDNHTNRFGELPEPRPEEPLMRTRPWKTTVALLLAGAAGACSDEPVVAPNQPNVVEAHASVSGSPRDREAIQRIVDTFDQTWGVDAATYAAQYADADFVGPTGENLTTAAAILQLYTNIFPAFAGTTRQSQIRALTFLTGTIAVLDIDTRISGALPSFVIPWQPNTARALEKNILVKRGGEWRIVQHQQTLVAPGVS